ncbi:GxxExxY protein [Flaviaesturariibacter amylovorans]|uniref:GxxExxY protein n=1 Tax=Flaviaesturariibacter amylovorans TaxID=1084520 RepID=A0ABP8H202_9BACT
MNAQELNKIGAAIVDAAIAVHRALGPGLLESAYKFCLAMELEERGLRVQLDVPLLLTYHKRSAGKVYEMDMVVNEHVVVELKAVEFMNPLYAAQTLTYLRIRQSPLAYLINFNVMRLKDGLKRIVHNFPDR